MKGKLNRSGFTLLEVIIVIIIVGILASLALPRFLRTVEYSRATEALTNLSSIRRAMNRCYLFDNSFDNCTGFGDLDVDDPGALPNAHFAYNFPTAAGSAFEIQARRNKVDNGDNTSTIRINQDGTKTANGVFQNIR